MIKVTVELWPFGIEEKKRVIGEMKIWNDASGTRDVGNYKFGWWRRSKDTRSRKCKEHTGMVKDFPRLRLNVFDLIKQCLNAEERPIRCGCGAELDQDGFCHHTHLYTPPKEEPKDG